MLSEELALADRYLAIETVRFGPRLAVTRSVEPAAERCLVPPLLIQPLIENAVKHGVATLPEGGTIAIDARRRGSSLHISVVNSRDAGAPASRGSGLGLENVKRRLAALDPDAARVDIAAGEADFRVTLVLRPQE